MLEKLEEIREQALSSVKNADEEELENIKLKYIGRKGELTKILKGIGKLSPEIRPSAGKLANSIKKEIEDAVKAKSAQKRKSASRSTKTKVLDITLPGRPERIGTIHPVTTVMREVCRIFETMGFTISRGPEIELDFYNFEALNIPSDHPARDMQDSFYVDNKVLLRTHTSPIQIRTMEKNTPPLRIIAPGKVYRCDSDVTHTPMFHQVEGLMVDRHVSFADLKGMLVHFIHRVFDNETEVRFRPSFFPFTEPSAEVDIGCVICRGKGCRVCSGTGWLEILGSGLVHPEVFRHVGYDPEEYSGFAFGLGIERIAMLKFGINDIRLFYENDSRFLEQFYS